MLTGGLDIGPRPANISHRTQMDVLYCCIYQFLIVQLTKMFMNMIEYDIVVMAMQGVT